MSLYDVISETFEIGCCQLGESYRTVLAAGASESDYKLALAFPDVHRHEKSDKIFKFPQKFLRLLKAHHIVPYLLVASGKMFELRNVERIRQAAHVKDKISFR